MSKMTNFLVAAAMLVIPTMLSATSYTWTGSANTSWNDEDNWDPIGVPGEGDDAIINSGDCSVPGGAVIIGSVNISGGTLTISNGASLAINGNSQVGDGGTLTVAGTLTLNVPFQVVGTLNLDPGVITGPGALNLSGTLNWESTSAIVSLDAGIQNSGTINVNGGAQLQCTVNNSGDFNIMGNVVFGENGYLFNESSITIGNDSDVAYNSLDNSGILNQGTLTKTAGDSNSQISVDLDNEGTITASTGAITLLGEGDHTDGNFVSAIPGYVSFRGTQNMHGSCGITGTNFAQLDDGEVIVVDTLDAGKLEVNAGTLHGDGITTVFSELSWTGGNLGSGTTSGSIEVTGIAYIEGGDILRCLLTLDGDSFWTDSFTVAAGGEVINNGSIDLQTDADMLDNGGAAMTNNGTLAKSGDGGVSQIYLEVSNSNTGIISIASGELRFLGGGNNSRDINVSPGTTFGISGSGSNFTNNPSGEIKGGGTMNVSGNFLNDGIIGPGNSPGTLTINQEPGGAIEFSDESVVLIEISGTLPDSEHDVIILDGVVTLGGHLQLEMIDGWIPGVDDMYTIIEYNIINGWFETIEACTATDDMIFEIVDNDGQVDAVLETSILYQETEEFICGGDSIELYGQYQSESGIYYDSLLTALGCDYVFATILDVYEIDNSVTPDGSVLTAEWELGDYQWINCDNGSDMPGENDQSFTPPVSGSFAVEITNNGCTTVSECVDVVVSSVREEEENGILVYPNPAADQLFIDLRTTGASNILIYNGLGEIVLAENVTHGVDQVVFDISKLPGGMYQVVVVRDGISKTQSVLFR